MPTDPAPEKVPPQREGEASPTPPAVTLPLLPDTAPTPAATLLLPDGPPPLESTPAATLPLLPDTPPAPPTATLPLPDDTAKQVSPSGATLPQPSALNAADTPPVPPAPVAVERIGRFEIRRAVGEGAFGRVYEAFDPTLKRTVALKVAKPEQMASPGRVERFLREARAAANLTHPNIVTVHESGCDGERHYIAATFVSGRSLQGLLEERQPGPTVELRRAVQFVRKLAEALAYAHRSGVIHRDVKPANVMLREDDEPLLMDFGLAAWGGEELRLTQDGGVMGTPPYLAPEQWVGKAEAASDQYSLGCLLFELLAGQVPFAGGSVEHFRFLHERRPAPSPRALRRDIPRDVETICLKCLEKEPARRYATCQELADDLRRWLDGEPIRARPVPLWEQAVKWARREPIKVGFLATGLLALVLLAFYFRAEALRAQADASAQRLEVRDLREQQEVERQVRDLWTQGQAAEARAERAGEQDQPEAAGAQVDQAAASYENARGLLQAKLPGDDRLAQIRERLDRLAVVRAALADRTTRAQAQVKGEQFLRACYLLRFDALDLAGQVPTGKRQRIESQARAALGLLGLALPASPEEAVRSLAVFQTRYAVAWEPIAVGCYEVLLIWAESEAGSVMGDNAEGQGRARQALELLSVARALAEANRVALTPTYHRRRARCLALTGEREEAEKEEGLASKTPARTALDHLQTALDAYPKDLGQMDRACREVLRLQPGHFWAHFLQAQGHLKNERPASAVASLQACLNARNDLPWPHLSLAWAHLQLNDFAESEAEFAEALNAMERLGGDRAGRYAMLTNRSVLWIRQKRWAQARADLDEAVRLQPRSHQAYANLGELHHLRGEWKEAVAALDQALALRPESADLYHTRARVHKDAGDLPAARLDFQQAIDREPEGARSKWLASACVELGYLKHEAGEREAALADYEKALRIAKDYLPALRQQADTLIALKRDAEAGRALDRYLELTRDRPDPLRFEVYRARGFVHSRLRESLPAVDAYTQALGIRDDTATRNLRGWVYLSVAALQPALADFEAVLAREPEHADALCGRAHVHVRLGKVREAVADVELAIQHGKPAPRLYLRAAGVHARVAVAAAGTPQDRSGQRAAGLLAEALGLLPAEERASFWKQNVGKDPTFAPLLKSGRLQPLQKHYER